MTATPHQPILGVGTLVLPRPRRAPSRAWRVLGNVVIAAVAVGSVVVAALLTVVPMLAGGHTLTVLSGSMTPAIPTGSVVAVRPVDPRTVAVGDVVTYGTTDQDTGAPELITHRVVAISEHPSGPVFTTRGDANRIADGVPVTARQVVGRVWYHVPWVGYARDVVFTRTGALFGGALVLVLIGFVLLGRIGGSVRTDGGVRSASGGSTRYVAK